MKPFLTLKSVDAVLALLVDAAPLARETVFLAEAVGRRLGGDFFAPADLPGFRRATVDGYAVRAESVFGASESSPALLELTGDCKMGRAPAFVLAPGQAAPILTGGMLPPGADCAVMVEYSRDAGKGLVEITRSQAPGDNIVREADDAAAGELLIKAGRRLRPAEIGVLAAFGMSEVSVYRRPEVAIISTGDELVPLGAAPGPAQIRDVNSHTIAALCHELGAGVVEMGICADEPEKLKSLIVSAGASADVVIVSGGSSAGARDHTVAAFRAVPGGNILAHGVAISPGKPFILAQAAGKWLLGLPGHVSSALVCAHVFLRPLLERLEGGALPEVKAVLRARLERSVASAQGRRDYIRCKLTKDGSELTATPITSPSAVISGLAAADGLIICPENLEGIAAGSLCDVELLE